MCATLVRIAEPHQRKQVLPKREDIIRIDEEALDEEMDGGYVGPSIRSAPGPYEQVPIWKLFKGRFGLVFHLCRECRNSLYFDRDRVGQVKRGERVRVGLWLCPDCIDGNIAMNHLYAQRFPYARNG